MFYYENLLILSVCPSHLSINVNQRKLLVTRFVDGVTYVLTSRHCDIRTYLEIPALICISLYIPLHIANHHLDLHNI